MLRINGEFSLLCLLFLICSCNPLSGTVFPDLVNNIKPMPGIVKPRLHLFSIFFSIVFAIQHSANEQQNSTRKEKLLKNVKIRT